MSEDFQELKKSIRERAHAARNALADKDGLSSAICERLVALPEYRTATTVMYYVDVRSEVRTRHYLQTALGHGKRIVVPYCVDDVLATFLLTDMGQRVGSVDVGDRAHVGGAGRLRAAPGSLWRRLLDERVPRTASGAASQPARGDRAAGLTRVVCGELRHGALSAPRDPSW